MSRELMQAANVLQTGLEQEPYIWLPPGLKRHGKKAVCLHLTGKGAPESNPYHGVMEKRKKRKKIKRKTRKKEKGEKQ